MEPIPQNSRSLGRLTQQQQRPQSVAQLSQTALTLKNNASQGSPLRAKSPFDLTQQFQPIDSSEFRRSQALLRHIREKEAYFLAQQHQHDQRSALSMTQYLRQSINEIQIQHSNLDQSSVHGISFEIGQHLADPDDNFQASRPQSQLSQQLHGRSSTSPLRNGPVTTWLPPQTFVQTTPQRHHESLHSQPSVVDIPMPSLDIQQMKYAEKLMKDNQSLEQKFQLAQTQLQRVNHESQRLQRMHGDVYQQTTQQSIDLQHIDKTQTTTEQEQEIAHLKNQNVKISSGIQKTDALRVEAVKKLRFLQNKREFTHTDFEDKQIDVQTKLSIIKETEVQRAYTTSKLDRVQRQIQSLQVVLLTENRVIYEDQCLVDKLMGERDDLMDKLCQLNQTYQNCVKDTMFEQERTSEYTRRQRQILAGKGMFQVLENLLRIRQQTALNDFFFYCSFDERCHRSLGQLANALEKCSRLKMSLGIKRWYQNTFDPIGTSDQIEVLSDRFYNMKMMAKLWAIWRSQSYKNKDKLKNSAIAFMKLWKLGNKDKFQNVKRAFQIWRSEHRTESGQHRIIQKVILRSFDSQRRQAFHKFVEHSVQHKWLARQQTLLMYQTQKQFKNQVLMKLKELAMLRKHKKQRKLKLLFKAWKDGLAYHRFLMAANVQAGHLRKMANKRLMCSVFSELRLSKELEKYLLLNENLTKRMNPAISQLNQEWLEIATKALKQRKIRGLKCLARNSCVGAAGYFNKWKQINFTFKARSGDMLKSFMMRNYRIILHQALLRWRSGLRYMKLKEAEGTAADYLLTQDEIQNRLKSLNRQVSDELYRQQAHTVRALQSCIKIFNRRVQQYGLTRWSQDLHKKRQNFAKGQIVIDRKWKIICKSAFMLFKEKTRLSRQEDKSFQRELYYQGLRQDRLKKKIFESLKVYVCNFKKSKRYWQIVFTHMECWVKRRTMVRWQERVVELQIIQKRDTQNQNTVYYDQKNVTLGQKVKRLTTHTEVNKDLRKKLMDQAQRVLSNAFSRYYYVKAARGIKQWRDRVLFEQHRETLLRRYLAHQKTHRFYFMQAGFQNWISQTKIRENKDSIKHTEQLTEDRIQLNINCLKQHQERQKESERQIQEASITSVDLESKRLKVVEMIARKNQDCNYQSGLRFIFQQWVAFVKRQKRFAKTITNVVQKSLWKTGFTHILHESERERVSSLQQRGTTGMTRMFWKKMCGSAFNIWREQRYQDTVYSTTVTVQEHASIQGGHKQFRLNVSDQNCDRSATILRQRKLSNYLKAWQNVHKWLKHRRAANQTLTENVLCYKAKRTMLHWHTLTHNGIKRRVQMAQFKHRQAMITKKAVFTAFLNKQNNQRSLIQILGHIAHKFDQKQLQSGLQMIKNFEASKKVANKQAKKNGALQVSLNLEFLFRRKISEYLSELRSKALEWKIKCKRVKNCLGYWQARKMRTQFQRWQAHAHFMTTVLDVNEDGPIVEEVLTQKLRLRNMVNFMKDQRYTKPQIDEALQFSQNRVTELLSRSIARMSHNTEHDDRVLKPIAFDRWKLYVKLRKLLKYIMRNVENQLAPGRADLSIAFNRWRQRQNSKVLNLSGQDRMQLVEKVANLDSKLKAMDELGVEKNKEIVESRNERDELFEGYVGGQRLAIALGRDNHQRSAMQAFNLLQTYGQKSKRDQLEQLLQKNVELIGKMKDRCLQFENENNILAADNEELRQSSLDGFDIARGAQQLSDDRERLSIDLADKAAVIKRLLEQHDLLSRSLFQARRQ